MRSKIKNQCNWFNQWTKILIFVPSVLTFNDYYPFGMLMPGRYESSDDYRYGFNGQEKDDEIEGVGNDYTAEYWQYSSRLGRRWNIDPELKQYSRYSTFANNPLKFRDPIGRDTLSFTGTNGRSINFFHKDLKKTNISLPFDLNIEKDLTLNFKTLPTVFGYSISLSGSYSYSSPGHATSTETGSIIRNYIVFTEGDFDWQPFPYIAVSGKSGLDATGDTGTNASVSFSPFFAWKGENMSIKDIKPESWDEYFVESTVGGAVYTPEGGFGLSLTGFMSSEYPKTGKGYYGFSVDISVGIGGGTNGSDNNISAQIGGSYFWLTEFYPTRTSKLLNSRLGKARLYVKWAEFMSGGAVPGTVMSDGFQLSKNIIDWYKSHSAPRKDYNTPTMLNGMLGGSKR